jgi:hypothetical protein
VSIEENNKALVRRFHEEAWNKGNVAAVEEFMAADYVDYPIPSGLAAWHRGLEADHHHVPLGIPRPEGHRR